jgi:tRNA (guanine37-N1)-methyltransferase
VVAPDLADGGLVRHLLEVAEGSAPSGIRRLRLVVGSTETALVRLARRAGYRPATGEPELPGTLELLKRR